MNRDKLFSSLIVLALFTAPAMAQQSQVAQDQSAPQRQKQAQQPDVQKLPPAIQALLRGNPDLASLSDQELKQRFNQARQYAGDDTVAPNVRQRLNQVATAARQELMRRQNQAQQNGQQKNGQQNQQNNEAQQNQQQNGQPSRPQNQRPPAGNNFDPQLETQARALIGDNRPAQGMSRDDLSGRISQAQSLINSGKVSPRLVARLQQRVRQDTVALNALDNQQSSGQTKPGSSVTPAQPKPATPTNPQMSQADRQAQAVLADQRRPDQMNAMQIRQRIADARNVLAMNGLSANMQTSLQRFVSRDTAALQQMQQGGNQNSNSGGNANANAEAQAKDVLADRRPPDKMNDQEIMRRLQSARRVIALNGLTPGTTESLRSYIERDAKALRERRDAANNPNPKPRPGSNTSVSINIDLGAILGDRRPPDRLSDEELRNRIRVYRDIQNSNDYLRYRQDERDYWRRQMDMDREFLRRRLLEDRQRRQAEIDAEERNGQLGRDIVINVNPVPSDVPADDIYAAEADDRQIEDILVAPPRERITRRYTIDEVANDPDIRRAIPRLEIDTIHFGFGEAIVREEEVRNLDRIGAVMEKIIARYPNEVFLVEGHTDAVGSDSANLSLSRARAEAVKQALTTYYDIPVRNLRTAGLGERFLKIPTPYAEAENRRVSISRVTQFIGQGD